MNQEDSGITKLGCVNHDCDQCKAQRTRQRLTDDNGGKTGWSPGLLQDDHSGLSRWLASKPDARQKVREALAQRTWVGLTLDERSDCYEESDGNLSRFAKAIEAKLKDKNGY